MLLWVTDKILSLNLSEVQKAFQNMEIAHKTMLFESHLLFTCVNTLNAFCLEA